MTYKSLFHIDRDLMIYAGLLSVSIKCTLIIRGYYSLINVSIISGKHTLHLKCPFLNVEVSNTIVNLCTDNEDVIMLHNAAGPTDFDKLPEHDQKIIWSST